ncbi:hypothetical protein BGZ94_001688 [Podila epigama]|nr:hypothetical protein BGZ94_001688 [Podila epigama]
MAALDEKVLDEKTGRPIKVLVCKEHVPMPRHSIPIDDLSVAHTTSAPRPSVPGLHRALMGERGTGTGHEDDHHERNRTHSPRSLDEGSHSQILRGLAAASASPSLDGHNNNKKGTEKTTKSTSTLPKFRNGRFTISAEEDALVSANDAQDPTKDDDSYRNLPVRHADYDDDHAADYELEDNKRERVFTLKGADHSHQRTPSNAETPTETKKHIDLTHHTKMLDHNKEDEGDDKHKIVDDDEWDAAPTDISSRREPIAGM